MSVPGGVMAQVNRVRPSSQVNRDKVYVCQEYLSRNLQVLGPRALVP
jgi:hypothetical protein